jgi:hypothetical protein
MLPFSTDWFMTWQPNFHSSLFYNIAANDRRAGFRGPLRRPRAGNPRDRRPLSGTR